jgi:hypothetical protein
MIVQHEGNGRNADEFIEAVFRERAEEKATLTELRTRARALGYKTISKFCGRYHLVHADGDWGMGAPCLDAMDYMLAKFEDVEARNETGAT